MNFVTSVPETDPIIIEGYFAATPVRVFEAWTDPAIVVKWFGHAPNSLHSATIDPRPGGAWRFLLSRDDDKSIGFEGQYQDIQPGEKLVFSWAQVIARADGARGNPLLPDRGDVHAQRVGHLGPPRPFGDQQ